ncbi:MAG: hypothetical protein QF775_04090, partial [archaeon]|nr:hypothetical protein [archaeon]
MIEQVIQTFSEQFAYNPEIANADKLEKKDGYVVVGMGGSHLAGDLIKTWDPKIHIVVYSDYGLNGIPDSVLENSLIITSSYSGNTEETVSVFEEAIQKGLSVAAISTGGKLLELAKEKGVPYVQLPDAGMQPRSALGYSIRGALKLMGNEKGLKETGVLASTLKPMLLEEQGKKLAVKLQGKIPVIYSSQRNESIAYNWRIKFHESA